MVRTYVYAFMSEEHRLNLGEIGVPDGQSVVGTMPRGGLTAVVSNYHGPEFSALPKVELMRCLAIHQRVVECAMATHTVLPVRFGTVLASSSEVAGVLEHWQGQIAGTLRDLGDAVEIEVAATWDLRQTFAKISCQPEIAGLVATVAGLSADEQMSTRVQIGKLVKEALERRREAFRRLIVEHLFPISRDNHANALLSDELVFNVAFLVGRAQLDQFYARIHQLDRTFENQLTLRCVGPLPPYTFATVEVCRPRADAIDRARHLFELGERASEKEINDCYRRLAFRHHPDRNQGDPEAAERFAALATAHELLLAYARSRSKGTEGVGEEILVDFVAAATNDVPILTIKRSKPERVAGEGESRELDHAVT